jgi:hypothetical protein
MSGKVAGDAGTDSPAPEDPRDVGRIEAVRRKPAAQLERPEHRSSLGADYVEPGLDCRYCAQLSALRRQPRDAQFPSWLARVVFRLGDPNGAPRPRETQIRTSIAMSSLRRKAPAYPSSSRARSRNAAESSGIAKTIRRQPVDRQPAYFFAAIPRVRA